MSDLTLREPLTGRLLGDEQVLQFINHGFLVFRPRFPDGYNEDICERLSQPLKDTGNQVTDEVPQLLELTRHPDVVGCLASLLGPDYALHPHRNFYNGKPGPVSQGWHVDGTNSRHHRVHTLILFYYPHEVTAAMAPTVLLPGSHFRNAPMDRMASYANIRGQRVLAVSSGTVVVCHQDLWHARTLNRSDRPRYMMKFVFERRSPPREPSWNHDAPRAEERFLGRVREFVGPTQGFCSDYLQEWELRRELWDWLRGLPGNHPVGSTLDFLVV